MLRVIAGIGVLQVAVVLVNMLRSKIVAVLLGPEGVGAIGVVDQLVQLVLYISTLNLPFVAVRFLSRAHSEGPDSFRRTFSSFLHALLAVTGIGAVGGAFVALVYPDVLGSTLAEYQVFLLPALVGIPAMACQGLFSGVLAAARRIRPAALLALISSTALAAASLVGIELGGIRGFYWGNLLANAIIVVGVAVYLRRGLHLPFFSGNYSVQQELRKSPEILGFALVFYANSLAFSFAFFVARFTVLTGFGEAQAGLLQAGISLYTSLNLVLGPANGLYLTPVLNRHIPASDKLAAGLQFQRKLWLVVLLVGMGMVLFAPWLVVLLFSSSFLGIANVVLLFVLAQCLYQIVGVNYALLIGLDDLRMYGFISVLGHLSLAGLAWTLAPNFGIAGVGLAFVGASSIHLLLTLARLRARFGMQLPLRWWLGVGYGVIALVAGGQLSDVPNRWEPAAILARIGVYGVFALSLLGLLDRAEWLYLVVEGQRLLLRCGLDRELGVGGVYRRLAQRYFPDL